MINLGKRLFCSPGNVAGARTLENLLICTEHVLYIMSRNEDEKNDQFGGDSRAYANQKLLTGSPR